MELARINAAKKELLFKIKEHEEDIDRIRVHYSMQEKREVEISDLIKQKKEAKANG